MAPRSSLVAAAAILGLTVACSTTKASDVEKVPVGTEVQVTRQDGGVVEGKLTAKDENTVKVSTGKVTKEVPKKEIADVHVVDATKPPVALPPVAKFREYTVPEDTTLRISVDTPLSSETSKMEDTIEGTLANPVSVDNVEVLPAGSPVRGTVTAVESAGKVKGRASMALQFNTLIVRDERVPISARWSAQAESTKKKDAKKIGIGAGAGAVIGGLIGGGKGAAIGAGVGGGAGTAMVLTSEGKPIALSRGEEISVKLLNPIEVKVPIGKR
jgi:hypothetical protein